MGKRGFLLSLEILVEIILVIGVILVAILWVQGEVSDSKFHKDYYAKDIAFLASTALAGQGDVRIVYDSNSRFDLDLELDEGRVSVYDDGFEKPRDALFAMDSDVNVRYSNFSLNKLVLMKEGELYLSELGDEEGTE